METATEESTFEKAKKLTIDVLEELIPSDQMRHVAIRLWDGTHWPDDNPRRTYIVLTHPGSLRAMFIKGNEVALGEAYLNNEFDIEGVVEDVFDVADIISTHHIGAMQKMHALWELTHLPANSVSEHITDNHAAKLRGKVHSIKRDKAAIAFHYNAGNDFYALWLDHRMVYSCAYFKDDETTLDEAQARKLEHICRKLRLQPGETLLDIGCGWGGMIIYAAKHYGVKATGITLSEEQAKFAQRRIKEIGIGDHCTVKLADYREFESNELFDKLVSVGMVEHVGKAMLPTYFEKAYSLLKPGGVFMNHGIGVSANNVVSSSNSFVDKYVFPDGELVPISEMLRVAENVHFEVRDVENLREHYMRTLRKWVQRLEANHQKALQLIDEQTYRVWRIYMAGSAYGFRTGSLDLYQSLLCKTQPNGQSNMPLTRDAWYD